MNPRHRMHLGKLVLNTVIEALMTDRNAVHSQPSIHPVKHMKTLHLAPKQPRRQLLETDRNHRWRRRKLRRSRPHRDTHFHLHGCIIRSQVLLILCIG